MMSSGGVYLLPDRLEPDLQQVQAYWKGLKRGDNDIPFWDDVKFSMRARLARNVMLLEVFETPLRFRFDLVGDDITQRYGTAITGKFTDEIDLHSPIDDLTAQCRATVERRANLCPLRACHRVTVEGEYRVFAVNFAAVGQWPH